MIRLTRCVCAREGEGSPRRFGFLILRAYLRLLQQQCLHLLLLLQLELLVLFERVPSRVWNAFRLHSRHIDDNPSKAVVVLVGLLVIHVITTLCR